jgi:hypothetical protein
MDRGLSCRQRVLKPGESGLESCMTDDGLVDGGNRDDHHKQGLRAERSGVEWRERGGEGWRKT